LSVEAAGTDAAGSGRIIASAVVETRAGRLLHALLAPLVAEQDRWFLWVPVLFAIGIIAYFWLPAEPALLAALMPLPLALVLTAAWRRGLLAIIVSGCVLAISLGFVAAKLRTTLIGTPVLERQMYGAEVAGYVEKMEPRPGRGQRLTIRVTSLGRLSSDLMPYRVRVRTLTTLPGLQAGDAVRLKATLAPPALPAQPGDYDFARAAWFSAIGAVGYSISPTRRDPDAAPPPWSLSAFAAIGRLRQAIDARITAALPGERGAIASALLTGERGAITDATNDAFRDSGLIHILSISGLHMVIMAGAVFVSVRLLLAAFPALALRFSIKKWAAATAILGAFGYLMISGSSYPTVRAWITVTIVLSAVLLDRPAIALRNVALAALFVMVLVPESVFDAGFQMSFAAVVALVATYELVRERSERRRAEQAASIGPVLAALMFFGGIILTTLVASAAVAPFSAYHFHKSQQFAIIANLIAIPICNIIVMPAALASLVAMPLGLEFIPLWIMGLGIDGMVWCAYAVAQLPGAVGWIPAFPDLAFGLMVMGGLWLCLWRRRWRLLGLGAIAAGLALTPVMSWPDAFVGDDGRLVAVRGPDQKLTAIRGPGSRFELERWLESEGDSRTARQAASGSGFRCDSVGCTATVKGKTIAVARHPAALIDDCSQADVLVIGFPKPPNCQPSGPVIDFFMVRDKGTHVISIVDDTVHVTSVADLRGDRPWSRRVGPIRRTSTAAVEIENRIGTFAAPMDLTEAPRDIRPEIEDDDGPLPTEPDANQ
jgi:competence protein ComEC